MKRIEYIAVAKWELINASSFYDSQKPGLGGDFLDVVQDTVKTIQRDPEMWRFCQPPIRSCRLARFPYRLFYRELSDCIQIIAVVHLSRKPGYWKDRIN